MSPSFIPIFFLNSAGIVIRPFFPTLTVFVIRTDFDIVCLIKNTFKSELQMPQADLWDNCKSRLNVSEVCSNDQKYLGKLDFLKTIFTYNLKA